MRFTPSNLEALFTLESNSFHKLTSNYSLVLKSQILHREDLVKQTLYFCISDGKQGEHTEELVRLAGSQTHQPYPQLANCFPTTTKVGLCFKKLVLMQQTKQHQLINGESISYLSLLPKHFKSCSHSLQAWECWALSHPSSDLLGLSTVPLLILVSQFLLCLLLSGYLILAKFPGS